MCRCSLISECCAYSLLSARENTVGIPHLSELLEALVIEDSTLEWGNTHDVDFLRAETFGV